MRTLVFLLLVAVATAKVYDRCEWARLLKANGMASIRGYTLADWVCLTQHESSYDTTATNRNTDGSTDYGIFQINSRWWCQDNQTPRARNGCGAQCSEMISSVSAAITCAKRVVRDPQGMAAWYGWRDYCRGKDLSSYVAGCGV